MYGRIAHVSMSVYNAQENPEPALIKVAWEAIKECITGFQPEELSQIIYYAHALQKLQPTHQKVIDLIEAKEYTEAAKLM